MIRSPSCCARVDRRWSPACGAISIDDDEAPGQDEVVTYAEVKAFLRKQEKTGAFPAKPPEKSLGRRASRARSRRCARSSAWPTSGSARRTPRSRHAAELVLSSQAADGGIGDLALGETPEVARAHGRDSLSGLGAGRAVPHRLRRRRARRKGIPVSAREPAGRRRLGVARRAHRFGGAPVEPPRHGYGAARVRGVGDAADVARGAARRGAAGDALPAARSLPGSQGGRRFWEQLGEPRFYTDVLDALDCVTAVGLGKENSGVRTAEAYVRGRQNCDGLWYPGAPPRTEPGAQAAAAQRQGPRARALADRARARRPPPRQLAAPRRSAGAATPDRSWSRASRGPDCRGRTTFPSRAANVLQRWPLSRHQYTVAEVRAIHDLPLPELMLRAQIVHREHHPATRGAALHAAHREDRRLPGGLRLLPAVVALRDRASTAEQMLRRRRGARRGAARAKDAGATRFCMGAAWREVKDGPAFDRVLEMVRGVKRPGPGGLLHARACSPTTRRAGSRRPGSTAYNHNLDTSREFYGSIISTRTYDDRLRTLARVRNAGITVCSGGIIGMGESIDDRCAMLVDARQPRPAPGERADQRAGAGAGHAARGPPAGRSARARAHDRDRAHPDAAARGAPVAPGGWRCRARRSCCASSRARTRSSTARSCSPPATRTCRRTRTCCATRACTRRWRMDSATRRGFLRSTRRTWRSIRRGSSRGGGRRAATRRSSPGSC